MLLRTGEARYADLIERTLYNGFLAGVSLDGERWLYVNPLQVRDGHTGPGGDQRPRRSRWFRVRLLPAERHAAAGQPAALLWPPADDCGLQIHQYATAATRREAAAAWRARRDRLPLGRHDPLDRGRRLADGRRPGRCRCASRLVPRVTRRHRRGAVTEPGAETAGCGWSATGAPATQSSLDLPLAPRLAVADPRVDAVRGCVAHRARTARVLPRSRSTTPAAASTTSWSTPRSRSTVQWRPELLGGVRRGHGRRQPAGTSPRAAGGPTGHSPRARPNRPRGPASTLTAIPYYAWANREDGAMRVWLPTS